MFRAIIKKRTDLQGPQIADIPVLEGSVSEDKTQKAKSDFTVINVPDTVQNGDILGLYDETGKFYYWGVITSKGEDQVTKNVTDTRIRKIECGQFESIYDDEQLITPQTSGNQKSFFNRSSISDILDFFLQSKEFGLLTMANTMNATFSPAFSGFVDKDLKDMYKGITHEVHDDPLDTATLADRVYDHYPFPLEKENFNLEDFIYETFSKFRRIIRPFIRRAPDIPNEYQPIQYVESDGSGQYIDTGIAPSDYLNTLKIELDGQFTRLIDDSTVSHGDFLLSTGYYNSTGGNRRNIVVGAADNFYMLSGAQISTAISMGKADLDRHLFVIDQVNKFYRLNNNTNFTTTVTNNLRHNIVLFAYVNSAESGSPITAYSPGRIYRCRIHNGDTLIRDFVPCYRKSDGVVGFYETVENQFYTNAGTGSFIKSNAITDKSIGVAIFKPGEIIPYDYGYRTWDYRPQVIFDTWESISNVKIVDEEVEVNTLAIYNDEGTTLRAAFTVLKDGTIQQIETDTSYPNRYGAGKTTYVFDSTNQIKDLAQDNIPASQFNHKITFDISFTGSNRFEDFNLGQPIKFYSKSRPGKVYESALTAWSYNISQDGDIYSATFTLGNVRTNLTSKINLNVKKKNKK